MKSSLSPFSVTGCEPGRVRKIISGTHRLILYGSLGIAFMGVMVPVLELVKLEAAAASVFSPLGLICHQLFTRSLWIFGHPMGICARCFAIYSTMGLIGLYMINKNVPSRCLWGLGLVLVLPLVLDGYSQLVGWRLSNNLLRVITGSLCGVGLALMLRNIVGKLHGEEAR